jgi:hypothetical protein
MTAAVPGSDDSCPQAATDKMQNAIRANLR